MRYRTVYVNSFDNNIQIEYCLECGLMAYDHDVHDEFHDQLDRVRGWASLLSPIGNDFKVSL